MHIEQITHGSLLEIKLSRPPVNALNYDLLDQLTKVFETAPQHGYRGIVLSGNSKVFSGGLDVPYLMASSTAELKACWSRFFDAARAVAGSKIPVVAAIGGHNPAGGCVLALCCDYRVMAEGPYRIGLNETQVGLVVPESIQYLMRRIIGAHKAERLIVAGAMIDSQQAFDIGLVDALAPVDGVLNAALTWLQTTAALPQTPMLASRAIARADIIHALSGFSDAELDGFVASWYSDETQATLQKVMEKLGKK